MRVGLYIRVSTVAQSCDMQRQQLTEYAQRRGWQAIVFEETASGGDAKRPVLAELVEAARKRRIDVVLVWRLDRLARSLKHLIELVELFHSLGVDFISYQESLDTTTPGGRLVFHVFGAVAEFEKSLISERIKAGIQAARNKGKHLGRPPIDQELVEIVLQLRSEGLSQNQVARRTGISRGSIAGIERRYGGRKRMGKDSARRENRILTD